MINLITPEAKREIQYARKNTALVRLLIKSYVLLFVLIGVFGFGYFWTNRTANSLDGQVASAREAIATQNLGQVQQKAESISNSLKLINQVLSKQVLFSRLFTQMGAIMPAGSALSQISVEKIEGGINFSVVTKDAALASQVQVNLSSQDAKLFESVDIVTLDCSLDSSSTASDYPCTISLRGKFAKNSDFYFVNSGTTQGAAQ